MGIATERKLEIISKHQLAPKDTGSAPVQIALITGRLEELQGHFETHKKDFHSQRGLLKLVGRRRRLLDYLKRTDLQRYRELIQSLGIRK